MRNCAIFVLASYCLVLKCFKYYMTMAVSLVVKDLRISCSILADPMRMWNWIIYEMQQKKKNIYPEAAVTLLLCAVFLWGWRWHGAPPWGGRGALCQEGSLLLGVFLPSPPPPLGLGWPHIRASAAPCAADMSIEGKTCWSCSVAQVLHGCMSKQLQYPHLCLPVHPSTAPLGAACPMGVVVWAQPRVWVTLHSLWCGVRAGIGYSGGAVGPLLPACCSLKQKHLWEHPQWRERVRF